MAYNFKKCLHVTDTTPAAALRVIVCAFCKYLFAERVSLLSLPPAEVTALSQGW